MSPNISTTDLQTFIQQTLEQWHVPGAAVAVIKDGQVFLCQGFGLRNLERQLPVTAETLFPIASCTKAFTAACLGLLVDKGKLEWDKPIHEYLPDFKLQDPHATALLTSRDLLCHRSGLPGHDSMWYETNFSRKDIFYRLQYLEPSCSLRSVWQYQNMLYMVAGVLVEELAGMSWEHFLQERIFDSLGMGRSHTSTSVTQKDPDHSRPYIFRKGILKEIPFLEADEHLAISSAGAISSCASDLIKWLSFHLNGGKSGEKTLIAPSTLAELLKPQIYIDDYRAHLPGVEFFSYGLGWFLQSYQGPVLVWHDGETQGFTAMVSFMPRQDASVIVLTNGDSFQNAAPYAITYTIYDRLLGLEPADWNGYYQQLRSEMFGGAELGEHPLVEQPRQTPPPRPLEAYLGDYEHQGYGVYSVRRQGQGLVVVRNKTIMPLEHDHDDVFTVTYELYGLRGQITFLANPEGTIAGFSARLEPQVKDLFFKIC
jgi:CubicO group peptidase (beta-lactamase class C family)